MTDDDTQYLEDLNVRHIRAENDEVDEAMADLEAKVDDLESEVEDKEAQIAELEEENEAYESLVADFREKRREEYLDRIRAANEAVAAEDEVDLSAFEDADPDTLKAVAEQVERLAEAAGADTVSNEKPDLSNADPDDGFDEDLEEAKVRIAEENGFGDAYRRIQEGELPGPGGMKNNTPGDDMKAQLEDLVGGDN